MFGKKEIIYESFYNFGGKNWFSCINTGLKEFDTFNRFLSSNLNAFKEFKSYFYVIKKNGNLVARSATYTVV